jgi:hypothetical protein
MDDSTGTKIMKDKSLLQPESKRVFRKCDDTGQQSLGQATFRQSIRFDWKTRRIVTRVRLS